MSQLKKLDEFVRPYLGLYALRKVAPPPQGGGVEWNTHVWSRQSINVLSAPATAKFMGLSLSMLLGGGIHRWRSGRDISGVASRSSRSCFNTSLVTMATMSAVLPAASGTPSMSQMHKTANCATVIVDVLFCKVGLIRGGIFLREKLCTPPPGLEHMVPL